MSPRGSDDQDEKRPLRARSTDIANDGFDVDEPEDKRASADSEFSFGDTNGVDAFQQPQNRSTRYLNEVGTACSSAFRRIGMFLPRRLMLVIVTAVLMIAALAFSAHKTNTTYDDVKAAAQRIKSNSVDYLRELAGVRTSYVLDCVDQASGLPGTRTLPKMTKAQLEVFDVNSVPCAPPPVEPGRVVMCTMYSDLPHDHASYVPADEIIEDRRQWSIRNSHDFYAQDMTNAGLKHWEIMYSKIAHLRAALAQNPRAEWAWWLDVDAVIMLDDVDMQEYLMSQQGLERWTRYDGMYPPEDDKLGKPPVDYNQTNLIYSEDENGFNAGSFLVRRGEWQEWLFDTWEVPWLVEAGHKSPFEEQAVLSHLIKSHKEVKDRCARVRRTTINADFNHYIANETLAMHFAGCGVNGHQREGNCSSRVEQAFRVRKGLQPKFYGKDTPLDANGIALEGEALEQWRKAEEQKKAEKVAAEKAAKAKEEKVKALKAAAAKAAEEKAAADKLAEQKAAADQKYKLAQEAAQKIAEEAGEAIP
ncbi:hypothetical protein PYCC9005_003367 [Savitreella phatthalungensis]